MSKHSILLIAVIEFISCSTEMYLQYKLLFPYKYINNKNIKVFQALDRIPLSTRLTYSLSAVFKLNSFHPILRAAVYHLYYYTTRITSLNISQHHRFLVFLFRLVITSVLHRCRQRLHTCTTISYLDSHRCDDVQHDTEYCCYYYEKYARGLGTVGWANLKKLPLAMLPRLVNVNLFERII